MRKKIKILLSLLTLVICLNGCKKLTSSSELQASNTERFFSFKSKTDPIVIRIISHLQKQNEASNFVENLAIKQGFPVWDKAIVNFSNKNSSVLAKGNESNTNQFDTIVQIPLVDIGNNMVTSFIQAKVNGTITEELYCASDYKDYFPSTTNGYTNYEIACKYVKLFLKMEVDVLDYKAFAISDNNLFKFYNVSTGVTRVLTEIGVLDDEDMYFNNQQLAQKTIYLLVENEETGCLELWIDHGNGDGPKLFDCNCGSGWTHDCDGINGGGGGSSGSEPSLGSNPYFGNSPSSGNEVWSGLNNGNINQYGNGNWYPTGGGYPLTNPPATFNTLILGWDGKTGNLNSYYDNYKLSKEQQDIIDKINAEDNASDQNSAQPCKGTNRTGNVKWNGTLEHWLIQANYVMENPFSREVEYSIPGAGAVSKGYADMVDTYLGEMFEIKPNNQTGINNANLELANYIAKANINCPRGTLAMPPTLPTPWKAGTNFTNKYLTYPKDPTKVLEALLVSPGIVGYRVIDKNDPNVIAPLPIPQDYVDKIKKLVERLLRYPNRVDETIFAFCQVNPDLANFIKNAAYSVAFGIIVGTLVEDILTLGAGIADDWPSFYMAYRIVRVVRSIP